MCFSVNYAGKTIDRIFTQVKQVVGYMNDITSASQEQSEGIEQVNQAITQMDGVTQQNSALVEQAPTASENMQSQASISIQLVNSFILVSSGQTMARGSGHAAVGAQLKTMHGRTLAAPTRAAPVRAALSNAKLLRTSLVLV